MQTIDTENVASLLSSCLESEFNTFAVFGNTFYIRPNLEADHEFPKIILDDLKKLTYYKVEVLGKSMSPRQNGDINIRISCDEVKFSKLRKFNAAQAIPEIAKEITATVDKIIKNLVRRMNRSKVAAKILELAISECAISYDDCICKGKVAEAKYKVGNTTVATVTFNSGDHVIVSFNRSYLHAKEEHSVKFPINNPDFPIALRDEVESKIRMAKVGCFVGQIVDSLGPVDQYGRKGKLLPKQELNKYLDAIYGLMEENDWTS